MVFGGNIIFRRHCRHFSWSGMLSNGNSHEKYFHQISNSYFELCFCSISLKNPMIFIDLVCTIMLYSHITNKIASKNHEIFNEIEQKIWFKTGVGILMKIFFMPIAIWQHSWPLRVSAVTSETIFPRKTMKIPCFFMFVGYCRDSYSKCMHYSIALQNRTFLRGRRAGSKLL